MLRREAQLEAIAEEQRARAGRRRQRLDAILSDTSELRNALESGALNDEERDRLIEAAVEGAWAARSRAGRVPTDPVAGGAGGEGEEGQSAMATLARELHAARRVQMADKMQALADETKALNSDRLNLEEARKGAWGGCPAPLSVCVPPSHVPLRQTLRARSATSACCRARAPSLCWRWRWGTPRPCST